MVDEEPEAAASVIRDVVQLVRAITVLAEPVLPGKAATWWDHVGDGRSVHEVPLEAAHESPPETFEQPAEPFEQLEAERIAALETELEARIEQTDMTDDTTPDVEPLVEDRISYADFQELDLRVARIEAVDPIEGADELLRLEVDLGLETRQIVAGLKQLYEPDALVGQKIIVVANLEKAELFGVESNGMLLAAGEEADLLTTHGDAEVGERIE